MDNDHDEAATRPLQIAWIDTTADDPEDTAEVTIWDPVEHRIEVFHADTGIPTTANRADIIDRAPNSCDWTATSSTASNPTPPGTPPSSK